MNGLASDGPVERPGATTLAEGDLLVLADAHRQLEQERATGAAVDAVDELTAATEAFTVAHLRGEPTADAMAEVVQAMFDVMATAQRAGLIGGAP